MRKAKLFTLIAGLLGLVASFASLFAVSMPTVKENCFSFSSTYGKKDVTLEGSYWDVGDSEYAVLICPGYSCDRQKWRPMANLFVSNGYSTMTFDYSGQGASKGTIGFDNAKTDNIPVEIDDAIETLHQKSGVDYSKIILVGHSMGGRAILRLFYDYNSAAPGETKVTKKDIKNAILLSPEVNYEHNAQASLFAGTSDAVQEPWKSYDASCIQGTDVYIYGSTADDIVSDANIYEIYRHLGATYAQTSGTGSHVETNTLGSKLTVGVTHGILHSYMMYSPEIATYVNEALTSISGRNTTYAPSNFLWIYFGWFAALGGLFLTLFSLTLPAKKKEELLALEADEEVLPIKLVNPKKFLLRKLLYWIPGIIMAGLLCTVAAVMPFGSPIMNIPYLCFIAGYGIAMVIHYARGRFPGTEGKLPKPSFRIKTNWKVFLPGFAIALGLIVFAWYVLRTSMYRLIPANWRLFWIVFATVLMAVGYYVSGVESDMLKQSGAKGWTKFLYQLVQYVPLFLFVGFYAVIGSWSGFIGQMQNMVLMYVFAVPLGNLVRQCTKNRLYGSLISAFVFQGIMITSAALISFF